MQPLVLGADFGNIVVVIIFVISILSGIINLIQGNKPDGTPRVKQPPKSPPDIDDLLRQLMGEKPKAKQEPKPPKPPKRQAQQADRGRSKPNPALERPAMARAPIPPRQTSQTRQSVATIDARDATLPTSSLGQSVRSHHLGNRVDQSVEKDISKAVVADLGNSPLAVPSIPDQPLHPLVSVLRDPQGIRQAVLLNEILKKPKGFRR